MVKHRCQNCRKAKVLCDAKHPTCSRCSLRNTSCVYSVKTGLKFVDQNAVAAENSRRARNPRSRPAIVQLVVVPSDGIVAQSTDNEVEPVVNVIQCQTIPQRTNTEVATDDGKEQFRSDADAHHNSNSELIHPHRDQKFSLSNALSQNKCDPFDSYGVGELSPVIQDAINYSYESLWPYSILSPDTIGHSLCLAERHVAVAVPFWFHTSISQASAVWLNFHASSDVKLRQQVMSLRREHTIKAIRVMRELQAGPGSDVYNIILTYGAFRLAVQPYIHGKLTVPSRFPVSPLARVQHLHVYGSMDIMPGFTDVVANRIKKTGGLPRFASEDRMPTSRIILLADIIVATRRDQPPIFEWPFKMAEDRIFSSRLGNYLPDHEATLLYSRLGQDLRFLTQADDDLRDVVELMVEATVLVDHFHRQGQHPARVPCTWQLGRARNFAQFHLCKFRRRKITTSGGLVTEATNAINSSTLWEIIMEICRLTMFLFSDMVLFPIPETTDVKPYFRKMLRVCIEEVEERFEVSGDKECNDFLTWAITTASLTTLDSEGSDARWWKSAMLRRIAFHGLSRVDTLLMEQLKYKVRHFLWWDYLLDPRLRELCCVSSEEIRWGICL